MAGLVKTLTASWPAMAGVSVCAEARGRAGWKGVGEEWGWARGVGDDEWQGPRTGKPPGSRTWPARTACPFEGA